MYPSILEWDETHLKIHCAAEINVTEWIPLLHPTCQQINEQVQDQAYLGRRWSVWVKPGVSRLESPILWIQTRVLTPRNSKSAQLKGSCHVHPTFKYYSRSLLGLSTSGVKCMFQKDVWSCRHLEDEETALPEKTWQFQKRFSCQFWRHKFSSTLPCPQAASLAVS